MQKLYLWSLRTSVTVGNHWVKEREVTIENAAAWRSVFEWDEPRVLFIISARKPPIKK